MSARLTLVHSAGQVLEVHLDGIPVATSTQERRILARLARRPDTPVLRSQALAELSIDLATYSNHISSLRRKLGGRSRLVLVGGRSRSRPSDAAHCLRDLEVVWVEIEVV